MTRQHPTHSWSQSDVYCLCPDEGHDASCPWVRGVVNGEIIGHVKECPVTGDPCPCLPGSIAHASCGIDAVQIPDDGVPPTAAAGLE